MLAGLCFCTPPFQQLPNRTGGEQHACLCVKPPTDSGFFNCATFLIHEGGTESTLKVTKLISAHATNTY